MSLIKAENLEVAFEGNTVFSGLSFEVNEGDLFCILGENGSGKTTLMRCILGLGVRYNGELMFSGFNRREIGWLPQRTETDRDFPAGVRELVLSGFAGKSSFGVFCSAQQRRAADKNMELLQISSLGKRSFSELSGGQQQRVLLCRALCAADRVLLLDEPVTGLDAAAKDELYSAIERLNKSGMTVIMITHDIDYAVSHASRILHIGNGCSFCGAPDEYANSAFYNRIGGEIQ